MAAKNLFIGEAWPPVKVFQAIEDFFRVFTKPHLTTRVFGRNRDSQYAKLEAQSIGTKAGKTTKKTSALILFTAK